MVQTDMARNTWIGTADETGINLLVPESDLARRHVTQQALRKKRLCFWALLEDHQAQWIRQLIDSGLGDMAVKALNQASIDSGCIPVVERYQTFSDKCVTNLE